MNGQAHQIYSMLTIPALTIQRKFDILAYMMIRILTNMIELMNRYRDYLIEKSIPKKVSAKQWADGYKKYLKENKIKE